ncbi:hypothetical protein COT42_01365 [Candidatus Saganbacteria bacterium CG08_land_8_20_14_0_20_45_16]|uniref:Uncharacterized protein n=1 Tax=Candidatus Saganbacteria bacterium CG08_land_8_20_14_0_20_45_16 TaxID=2014293 RepID=A0A2H0Y3C1_UNCSA|nr:MAG: hypothetical protein COT42_01365 [Candidatus Saganbacteria bacterium CG08_land_8_20_14_0_20_45_16]
MPAAEVEVSYDIKGLWGEIHFLGLAGGMSGGMRLMAAELVKVKMPELSSNLREEIAAQVEELKMDKIALKLGCRFGVFGPAEDAASRLRELAFSQYQITKMTFELYQQDRIDDELFLLRLAAVCSVLEKYIPFSARDEMVALLKKIPREVAARSGIPLKEVCTLRAYFRRVFRLINGIAFKAAEE